MITKRVKMDVNSGLSDSLKLDRFRPDDPKRAIIFYSVRTN